MSQNINSLEKCVQRLAFNVLLRKLEGKQVEEHVIVSKSMVVVYVVVDSLEWRVAFYSDGVSQPVLTQILYQEA